jgi:hypothetical protein
VRQIRREIGLDKELTRSNLGGSAQMQSRHSAPAPPSHHGSNAGSNYASRYQAAAVVHQQQHAENIFPTSRRFPAVVSADLSAFSSSASPVYRIPAPSDEYDDDDDFSQLDSELEWN